VPAGFSLGGTPAGASGGGFGERVYNPDFNPVEFDRIKSQSGLNSYRISAKEWCEKTNAIGIQAKSGRYGGTYAHKDIAMENC